jgi:hypothetical protein
MAGMLYSLVALGFVLIFKASGVFNFAQGAMVLFAALAMARFSEWIPIWLGIESRVLANVAAFYDGPADREIRARWVDEVSALLHTGDDGAYVNFLADEGEDRVRAAYPGATWERLSAVKATYDPENLFRRNQNVLPSQRSAG